MDIFDKVKEIENLQDLSNFVLLLKEDFQKNKNSWENRNLESYFESLSAWLVDMEPNDICNLDPILDPNDLYKKHVLRLIAQILLAPKVYE